jgi:hypothetical protein
LVAERFQRLHPEPGGTMPRRILIRR